MSIINNDSRVHIAHLTSDIANLPDITFNFNVTDMQIVNNIADALEIKLDMSNLTKEQAASTIVEQVLTCYQKMKTDPEYGPYFAKLDSIASRLGENIASVFTTLKQNVRPDMESLKEQIMNQATVIAEKENRGIFLNPVNSEPAVTFEVLDWDKLFAPFGGTQEIIEDVKQRFDLPGIGSLSFNEIHNALYSNALKIERIKLADETFYDIVKRASENTNSEFDFTNVLKLIVEPYHYGELLHSILAGLNLGKDISPFISKFITEVSGTFEAVRILKSTPLDVSDDVLEKLHTNIEKVNNLFVLAAYQLIMVRMNRSNALILSESYVNGDKMPEYESQGGNIAELAKHMQVSFLSKQIPVPSTGITTDQVISYRDDTKTKYDELMKSYLLKADSLKQMTIARAAKDVLYSYLESTDSSRLPEGMYIDSFVRAHKPMIQTAINKLNANEDGNLENVLYDFLLDLWYNNTPVQLAHQLFGKEVMRHLEISQELTDDTLALIDAGVGATLAANFIMKELMTVK